MIFFWQRSALGYFLAGEEWKLSVQRDQASNWITFDFRLLDYKSEIVSDQRFRPRNVANFGFNLRPLLKSVDTFNCRIICSRSRRGSWSHHPFDHSRCFSLYPHMLHCPHLRLITAWAKFGKLRYSPKLKNSKSPHLSRVPSRNVSACRAVTFKSKSRG